MDCRQCEWRICSGCNLSEGEPPFWQRFSGLFGAAQKEVTSAAAEVEAFVSGFTEQLNGMREALTCQPGCRPGFVGEEIEVRRGLTSTKEIWSDIDGVRGNA